MSQIVNTAMAHWDLTRAQDINHSDSYLYSDDLNILVTNKSSNKQIDLDIRLLVAKKIGLEFHLSDVTFWFFYTKSIDFFLNRFLFDSHNSLKLAKLNTVSNLSMRNVPARFSSHCRKLFYILSAISSPLRILLMVFIDKFPAKTGKIQTTSCSLDCVQLVLIRCQFSKVTGNVTKWIPGNTYRPFYYSKQ